jgi:hypothetical protein
VFAEDVEVRVWDKVVSFFRQPEVIEAEVRRILDDMPIDTVESDLESSSANLAKSEKLYGKMYAKLTLAMANDDDMLATRLETDCKLARSQSLSECGGSARGETRDKGTHRRDSA